LNSVTGGDRTSKLRNVVSPVAVAATTPFSPVDESRRFADDGARQNPNGGGDCDDFPTAEEVVELNVGGCRFTTSRSTLCRVTGSHLESLFSGRHARAACRDASGSVFVDRDGR